MIGPVPLFIHEIKTNTYNPYTNFYGFCHVIYFMCTHVCYAMNDMFSLNPLIYLPILSICLSCSCDLTDLSRLSSNKTFFQCAQRTIIITISCQRFSLTVVDEHYPVLSFTQYPFNTTTQPLLFFVLVFFFSFCLYLTSYTNLCILYYFR